MGGNFDTGEQWQRTPCWNVRALFWPMRRWRWDRESIGGPFDGEWEYATYEQCARTVLEEAYGHG